MGTEYNNNMDDSLSREQAQECLGCRSTKSGAVVSMDSVCTSLGSASDEHCSVDCVHKEPRKVDTKELEAAIWSACWGLMITYEEAVEAIAKHCKPEELQ